MEKINKDEKHPFPNVFFDLSLDDVNIGRVEFELFSDCPLTSENFRCLCTGEKGLGRSGKPLHYKGIRLHRIIKSFVVHGGDILHQDGTGGESIYGYSFEDENFNHKHNKPFRLGMANCGFSNTNGS